MSEWHTETIELSLLVDDLHKLKAFTRARNGSIHNCASEVIRAGIDAIALVSPEPFKQRLTEELRRGREG